MNDNFASENEQRNKLTPSQEKEKLMKQVKNDNDMWVFKGMFEYWLMDATMWLIFNLIES